MAESNALVSFLSDPETLIGLGVVAAGTYLQMLMTINDIRFIFVSTLMIY